MKVNVGDTIRIIEMQGEPQYTGREGVVRSIDDMGQLHGDWADWLSFPVKTDLS